MITKFVEVTNGPANWGKFLVMRFDETEYRHMSVVDAGRQLLFATGWNRDALWIMDIQTREGAAFVPGGAADIDLEKHKIWVCPMFQPFLIWLYAHPEHWRDIETLPDHVDLPDAPFAMAGYRRPGPKEAR